MDQLPSVVYGIPGEIERENWVFIVVDMWICMCGCVGA